MNAQNGIKGILNQIEQAPDIPNLVANQIIKHIASGALKPGDKLPSEKDMQLKFGISRISLRGAMKLLEAKGYIASHGRRGKFVKTEGMFSFESSIGDMISIDHGKIWDLLAVRRVIDSEAARMAALNATKAQIEKLKLHRLEIKKVGAGILLNSREGGRLYAKIYNDLADATNNMIYARLMKSISTLLRGVLPYSRQKLTMVAKAPEILHAHHVKIIESIEKRNPEKAKRSVIEHIDWLEKTLKRILK